MKTKKWLALILAGLMTCSVIGFTACDNGSSGNNNENNNTQQGGNTEPKDETVSVTVTYEANQGTVTLDPAPADGKIKKNTSVTVTVTAKDGYEIDYVEINGSKVNLTDGKCTFTANADTAVTAVFKAGELPDEWHNQSLWLAKDPLVPTGKLRQPSTAKANSRSKDVAVHDPSIFQDPKDGTYYAFGTHYATASSEDLIEWKQVSGDNAWQKLYGTESFYAGNTSWPKAIKETVDLVNPDSSISTTWAPDVEYINGKYYMYYSVTKAFGSNESAIARVESDNVLGPYSNNVIIINSVGANRNTEPNCIDPELFYDKDGRLWMVYGSFMGGVYIKELNTEGEKVGLPKNEKEGWGKLLWKDGYAAGVEGPFVFYNASTEYYYLMVSEGDLKTVYNMRIARSKNPDGPYEDITGADVAGAGKGNKIAGNYKIGTGTGYGAMGHNSVIKDKNGRYFVVYHARRETNDGVSVPHKLFVSQLYFNEEGWPVMSPNAYCGERAGAVEESNVVGEYDLVLHSVATEAAFTRAETYTFTADHKVLKGGTEVGTWAMKQNYYISVTVSGVAYSGVVVPGWDMYGDSNLTFSVTAVSGEGRSLWAVHKPA